VSPDPYDEDQIMAREDLANTIARQAEALAAGKVTGPQYAAAQLLLSNAKLLAAWTPDDRTP
jgi:hypothetical protein